MQGDKLLRLLKSQLFVESDADLADLLGLTVGRISQLRYDTDVKDGTVNSLIKKALSAQSKSLSRRAISPIVEFFETEMCQKSERSFIDVSKEDRKVLQNALKATKGVYSFYNSELEIIYVGKTKNDLWTEICNAYNRKMPHYHRYYVNHPHGKYSAGKALRQIKRDAMYLYDAASYFSAYSVEENLIDAFETLIIRMIPNDLLNVRMEGNNLLSPFSHTSD
ncbi:hypothetical protein [Parvibaculum sp.]|uniref:hypothetical protein n=1 Tax=Parvibaculum sp. TaxID=2024848 RepID=UPI000C43303B|nr:hypothetical protein [Parvibaculum sp.]MAM96055.1 hypothetical protein [Parvibaculum sp.]|tara:strand:+ start:7720 stop:8385 length:666 start_codon:yes stop_codon:yes gene_type:complete